MDRSVYRNLPLPALNNECARELVDELLGKDPSAQSLAQKIVSRTAGNPFFTEELVRAPVEGGVSQDNKVPTGWKTPLRPKPCREQYRRFWPHA